MTVLVSLVPTLTAPTPCAVTPIPIGVEPVRITAADLALAQSVQAGLRRELVTTGAAPDSIAVLLDVYVHVAADARTARKEVAVAAVPQADSLTYVGTSHGLASLIADIKTAEVADGVTLIPLLDDATSTTRVVSETLPALAARGADIDTAAVAAALRSAGIEPTARVLAS